MAKGISEKKEGTTKKRSAKTTLTKAGGNDSAKKAAAEKAAAQTVVKSAVPKKKAAPKAKAAKTAVKMAEASEPKKKVRVAAKKVSQEAKMPATQAMNDTLKGESKKFEIEDVRGYYEPKYELKGEKTYELPQSYGDTRITLLVQDPYWVHAYWEINSDTRKKFGIDRNNHDKDVVIRVYHAASGEFFDINVRDNTRSWYFQVPSPNAPYYSEIGTLQSGKFSAFARSNVVFIPTDKALPIMEEGRQKTEALFQRSGGYIVHKQVGSEVVSEWNASPIGKSSASGGISSGSGGMAVSRPAGKKGFWAEIHTELIVYGATEPSAKVTLGGVPIRLTSDGKFSIRFYLKDGQHPIPFIAVSDDGSDRVAITPFVSKSTERKE